MKKYTTIILSAVIVVLAALLVGILIFLKNQPVQQRATEPLVQVKAFEPDSAIWGLNFPNQYDTLIATKNNTEDTEFGGSSAFSWLKEIRGRQFYLPDMDSARNTTMTAAMNGAWKTFAAPNG